jgi:hypothetical protein
VLLLSGFKLLQPLPGNWTDITVLVGVGLGVLVFATWGGVHLLSRRSGPRPVEELSP